MSGPSLSVIVPVLNEAEQVGATLTTLAGWRAIGVEVIVVDGGSRDGTPEQAAAGADQVIIAARGRAVQMNAGAAAACGAVLLFLHADTHLPPEAPATIAEAVAAGALWGRFDVRIAGRHPLLPLVAWMMNQRSRLTGIATGDQGIFVTRAAFEAVGGFPAQPLMEDIELSTRLRRLGRPACLSRRAMTSGRRWDRHGFWRTVLLMWSLRLAYWRGADPARLARRYAPAKDPG